MIRVLLEVERPLPTLPAFTRARALARAREAVALSPPAPPALLPAGLPRWTLPLAIAGASLATMAIVHHFEGHAKQPPALLVVADSPDEAGGAGPRTAGPFRWVPVIPEPATRPATREETAQASAASAGEMGTWRAELELLQRARAAVAADDWSDAQSAVNEHARRFPGGQLVEEREALRVKTLIGLGKAQEARQAARAFGARFPRSVLGVAVSNAGGELL